MAHELPEEDAREIFRHLTDRGWEAKRDLAVQVMGLSKKLADGLQELSLKLEQIGALEREAGISGSSWNEAARAAAKRDEALDLAQRLDAVYGKLARMSTPLRRRSPFETLNGSVDLSCYDLRPGDTLEFSIKDEATGESVVRRFQVRDYGWNFSLATAVLFTRQTIPRPSARGEPAKRTFQPAPAIVASVSWKYQYPNAYVGYWWNLLSPSLGVAVAHVDFDSTKEVEVAPAVNLGLFNNTVYLGYGRDVMIETGRNYMYFGFGFDVLSFTAPSVAQNTQ